MHLIVIAAFALVLSEELPPRQLNLLPGVGLALLVLMQCCQLVAIFLTAKVANHQVLKRLDGSRDGHDSAADTLSFYQRILLGLIAAALVFNLVCTPWAALVREMSWLGRIPLVGDLLLITPFFVSLVIMWWCLYPAEMKLRHELSPSWEETNPGQDAAIRNEARFDGTRGPDLREPNSPDIAIAGSVWTQAARVGFDEGSGLSEAQAAMAASRKRGRSPTGSRPYFLMDRFRHQVLLIAAPMSMIVLAKNMLDPFRDGLVRWSGFAYMHDTLLGCASAVVLFFSPVLLKYVWVTEPLPDGPLRRRFERLCGRIPLRYRDILIWHTHGTTVNAAVMGFVAPFRYILVSDALLETMRSDEIEAVFGHEAGHVRHHHLPFFALFALLSMYVAGGAFLAVYYMLYDPRTWDQSILDLISLTVLLLCWLLGFGYVSRRFERQADLFGVRSLTQDMKVCVDWCPLHGGRERTGLCASAVNVFGRTLRRIADLNGIPHDAWSWRHGSIQSRCRHLEDLLNDTKVLRTFERTIAGIKLFLFLAGAAGTTAAGFLYWPAIARAMGWN